jgi:hypothetical protein
MAAAVGITTPAAAPATPRATSNIRSDEAAAVAMFDAANTARAVSSSRRCGQRRVSAIRAGPTPAYASAKTVTVCPVAAGELWTSWAILPSRPMTSVPSVVTTNDASARASSARRLNHVSDANLTLA